LYCIKKIEENNIDDVLEEVFEIADKFNLVMIKGMSYIKLGDSAFNKLNYNKAFIEYNQAIPIYKDQDKDEIIPYLYWKIGLCKERNFQYEDAIIFFKLCEHYSVLQKDIKTHQLALYDKALCYKKTDELDLALEAIDKYLAFSDKEEDTNFYIYANVLKANCYSDMGKTDTAIETYHHLLSQISQDNNPSLGLIYTNLGLVYLNKDDFKRSLESFEKSEDIRTKNDKINLSHTLIEKSEYFSKQGLYEEAIKTIQLGLASAAIYKDYEYLLKGNYNLAAIYERMSDISNLKSTYLAIITLLKEKNKFNKLASIYVKLSLIYLDENNINAAKECLVSSQKLRV